jgi:hypothetical protein
MDYKEHHYTYEYNIRDLEQKVENQRNELRNLHRSIEGKDKYIERLQWTVAILVSHMFHVIIALGPGNKMGKEMLETINLVQPLMGKIGYGTYQKANEYKESRG